MKTVQMTLDDELVEEVDQAVGELRTTRSAFASDALRAALQRHREAGLEEKHRLPVSAEEFSEAVILSLDRARWTRGELRAEKWQKWRTCPHWIFLFQQMTCQTFCI